MAIRIGGLASGMDIDTLVGDLMKAERIPLNKLNQNKQILEWQRDDYRSMNKLLSDFDQFVFDNISLKSKMITKQVTSTNSSAVTATANSSAANINTTVNVTSTAKSATWISNNSTYSPVASDTEIELTVTNGDGTVASVTNPDGTTSNVIKLTIKAGATLDDVLKELSNKKELGISAFSESGKVVITKNDTGAKAAIKLVDGDAQSLFQSLGFTSDASNNVTFNTSLGAKAGENADYTINGLRVTDRASNTFTINNVNYTLHSPGQASLTVSGNTDHTVDKIVEFVSKYNEMIEKINSKLSESHYRDYKPLTAEEKGEMSEKQVELWEERAKSGLLRNDSILSGSLSKLRMDIYNPVNQTGSTLNQLTEIGITTSTNFRDKGKLVINEAKLREAVEKDPDAVFTLFNASGTNQEDMGLAVRVRETIKNTISNIEQKAGRPAWTNQQFSIGRTLGQVDSQINRFEDRLTRVEQRYWRQFTAMEQAIQRANEQSASLMQQFSM